MNRSKAIIGAAKRSVLFVLIALFACAAIGLSVYLDSTRDRDDWSMPGVSSTSTPTAVFLPAEGWWDTVATPAP